MQIVALGQRDQVPLKSPTHETAPRIERLVDHQITGIAAHRRLDLIGLDLPTVLGLQRDGRDIRSSKQRRLLHRLVTGGKDDGVIGAGQ
jgi:hypothetical protein